MPTIYTGSAQIPFAGGYQEGLNAGQMYKDEKLREDARLQADINFKNQQLQNQKKETEYNHLMKLDEIARQKVADERQANIEALKVVNDTAKEYGEIPDIQNNPEYNRLFSQTRDSILGKPVESINQISNQGIQPLQNKGQGTSAIKGMDLYNRNLQNQQGISGQGMQPQGQPPNQPIVDNQQENIPRMNKKSKDILESLNNKMETELAKEKVFMPEGIKQQHPYIQRKWLLKNMDAISSSAEKKQKMANEEKEAIQNANMQAKFSEKVAPFNRALNRFDDLENILGFKLDEYDPKKHNIPGFTDPLFGTRHMTGEQASLIDSSLQGIMNDEIKQISGAQTSVQEIQRNLKALGKEGTLQSESNLINRFKKLREIINQDLNSRIAGQKKEVLIPYIKNGGALLGKRNEKQKWINDLYNEKNVNQPSQETGGNQVQLPPDMTPDEIKKFQSLSPEAQQEFLRRISNG